MNRCAPRARDSLTSRLKSTLDAKFARPEIFTQTVSPTRAARRVGEGEVIQSRHRSAGVETALSWPLATRRPQAASTGLPRAHSPFPIPYSLHFATSSFRTICVSVCCNTSDSSRPLLTSFMLHWSSRSIARISSADEYFFDCGSARKST